MHRTKRKKINGGVKSNATTQSSANTNSGTPGTSAPKVPGTLDQLTVPSDSITNGNAYLDARGDGSGDFGRNCPDPSQTSGSGPKCTLVVSYTDQGRSVESEFTPSLYEFNLLRTQIRSITGQNPLSGAIPSSIEEVYAKIRYEGKSDSGAPVVLFSK